MQGKYSWSGEAGDLQKVVSIYNFVYTPILSLRQLYRSHSLPAASPPAASPPSTT
jgi:hypothetical protein